MSVFSSLSVQAIIAGIFFGIWPLFMQRSGLVGNASAGIYTGLVLVLLVPFAVRHLMTHPDTFTDVKWMMIAFAAVTGAAGMLFFNNMLGAATKETVGGLIVVMIIAQTALTAAYAVWANGTVSWSQAIGFVLAGCAAYLLLRE